MALQAFSFKTKDIEDAMTNTLLHGGDRSDDGTFAFWGKAIATPKYMPRWVIFHMKATERYSQIFKVQEIGINVLFW